jgi:hypothetical protein
MKPNVENLLREGMDRCTRDLRAPAGLVNRAAQQRRRRLALQSAAGLTAALAASAAALVAVLVPGGGAGAAGVVLAAHVVQRVDSALSAAEPGDIAQVTLTTHSAAAYTGKMITTTAQEWSYGDQWRSLTNSASGSPVYDEGSDSATVYTLVNYQARVWARLRGIGRPNVMVRVPSQRALAIVPSPGAPMGPVYGLPGLFHPGLPGIGFSASSPPATAARDLRTEISWGALVVTGRQRVNGIDAIKLRSRASGPVSETVWVSPGSYLPVRVIVRLGRGRQVTWQTANISWLPPTAQNLAKLTVPIPAGFRRVSLADGVGLIVIPGGRDYPVQPAPRSR